MLSKKAVLATLTLFVVLSTIFIWYDASTKTRALRIGVIAYPGFAPFYIAQEKEFFEKEGVNAEVITINDPTHAISALASNDVQMLFSSADFTVIVKDAGVDVKEIFASDIGYGSDGLLVKNEVQSISDLNGKTVYLSIGTPSHFLLRYLAKEAGLSANDITLVSLEADQVGAAFVAGKIDYGMSWEPWLSKAADRADGKLLFSSKDKPGIVTDTFIVRTDVLEVRRSDVQAVMRAWFDAIEFIKSNPDEANEIMANNLGLPVEDFEAQVATVKFLDCHENIEKFNKETLLNIVDLTEKANSIYIEDDVITSIVNPNTIVDSSLLVELCK